MRSDNNGKVKRCAAGDCSFCFWRGVRNDAWRSFGAGRDVHDSAVPLLGNTHIAADLNGDGKTDLAGAGANAVSVMLGNGDGTFRAKTDFPVGAQAQAVAAGDFNSDGKVDLLVTLNSPQLSLALLTGTGTGTFNAPTFSQTLLDSIHPLSRRRISMATAGSIWW